MSLMRIIRLAPVAFVAAALLVAVAPPASAGGGTKDFSDAARGFTIRVPETFKQNPPKPTGDPKYKTASFNDDQAKYKSSGSENPEFNVGWWSTPKKATTPGKDGESPYTAPPSSGGDEGGRTFDDVLDSLLTNNPQLFGKVEGPAASADRWKQAKTAKTAKQKIDFKYWEFTPIKPKKADKPKKPEKGDKGGGADSPEERVDAVWYAFAARLTIERPQETVEVTFEGTCALQFVKNLGPAFLDIVKSFETRDTGAGPVKVEEVPDDPDAFRDFVKRTKVVAGWKCVDSPKKQYVLLYDEGVDEKLVKTIAEQVESLREQVYEVMFKPDKPITAVSLIRVCKDRTQYMAYGAPGGTAGYWSSDDMELVFYEDTSNKKDSLRVLYHEAFHQYIYYSVGACDPHSWFNEGHGDYFYGHNFKDGRWQLGKSLDRVDTAAKLKREGKAPRLTDFLHWSQDQYYGSNEAKLSGLECYALGWDFVYFLRTTKKKEYEGILQRYFDTLKGLVTAARAARMKENPGHKETAKEEELANRHHEDEWCEKALAEGFKGVDLDQLYKDWIANTP
jgi:hypothetical protein